MINVQHILDKKVPRVVIKIDPNKSIYEALELMEKHDIGAICVFEADKLVGLFTEREYSRDVVLKGKKSMDTKVGEAMISKLWVIPPTLTVMDSMAMMTAKRIRYLPVADPDGFYGIISIGDVVKAVMDEQASNIEHLEKYLTASDYGI